MNTAGLENSMVSEVCVLFSKFQNSFSFTYSYYLVYSFFFVTGWFPAKFVEVLDERSKEVSSTFVKMRNKVWPHL